MADEQTLTQALNRPGELKLALDLGLDLRLQPCCDARDHP
jgi:hypothetical protein